MPLKKIADERPRACLDREHDPPGLIVLSPGTYEHTCPRCGHKTVFEVRGVYC
jgi:hypothetical protein